MMDAPAADDDLPTNELDPRKQAATAETEQPREPAARLPGESPEGLNVESLEERVLLSADGAAQAAAASAVAAPEEPPALVGSPVAGEGADASGSHAQPIVTDGRSGASASDAGEVVAELAKSSNQLTGGAEVEHKSHSTESGEIGEVKTEASSEQASEVNESERLERGAQQENKAGGERDDHSNEKTNLEKTNLRRPVAGEARVEAPIASNDRGAAGAESVKPEALAAQLIAADAAVEAHGDLGVDASDAKQDATTELRNDDAGLGGVIDRLGVERADQLVQGEKLAVSAGDVDQPGSTADRSQQTPAAADQVLAEGSAETPAAATDSAAALAQAHAEHVMAELQAADETTAAAGNSDVRQAGPVERSQRIDAPQAHDALFAAAPDLAALAGGHAAVAPAMSEASADET